MSDFLRNKLKNPEKNALSLDDYRLLNNFAYTCALLCERISNLQLETDINLKENG